MYPYVFYTQESRAFATKIKVCKKNHLLEDQKKIFQFSFCEQKDQ